MDGGRRRRMGSSATMAERSGPTPGPEASAGKRWRFRRNLVIYLAHRRNGLSQRLLADVFDLPRSRIGEIVREYERLDPESRP